ncbi:hypothetical protein BDV59DRAFT_104711 [Aspergillus ambiguus]|uniref:uncharacterized protein n=1 Tax=Aspergillus ambiguus TaxID=176160 RepID=UPI003CCC95BD
MRIVELTRAAIITQWPATANMNRQFCAHEMLPIATSWMMYSPSAVLTWGLLLWMSPPLSMMRSASNGVITMPVAKIRQLQMRKGTDMRVYVATIEKQLRQLRTGLVEGYWRRPRCCGVHSFC